MSNVLFLSLGSSYATNFETNFGFINEHLEQRNIVCIVNAILKKRQNVNNINQFNKTPLMLAYEQNDHALFKKLLKAGADPTLKAEQNESVSERAKREGKEDFLLSVRDKKVKFSESNINKEEKKPPSCVPYMKSEKIPPMIRSKIKK